MKKYLVLAAMAATMVAPGAAQAKRYNLIMTFGQDVLVAGKEDDVAIRAQCIQNDGFGNDVVRVYAKVGHNSVMKGIDYFGGAGSYASAATAPADAEVLVGGDQTGTEFFGNQIDSGFVLNLTTMHGYAFTLESSILGVNGGGTNDCVLSINLDAIKKFKTVE